jgi:hypothetical protein
MVLRPVERDADRLEEEAVDVGTGVVKVEELEEEDEEEKEEEGVEEEKVLAEVDAVVEEEGVEERDAADMVFWRAALPRLRRFRRPHKDVRLFSGCCSCVTKASIASRSLEVAPATTESSREREFKRERVQRERESSRDVCVKDTHTHTHTHGK